MARRRAGDKALGILLLLAGPIWLFTQYPVLAVVILAMIVAAIVLVLARPRACEVSGTALKRTAYKWHLDGAARRVCPTCNRSLEKRQSNRALGV
jgi:hypothetical protein